MNKPTHPPKLPLRFFRWFCRPDLLPYIEGDLIELFEERVRVEGVRKAKWLFAWDVVKLFRPGIIRPAGGYYKLNHYGMFRNYVKIAFRVFRREKIFTAINILGLTAGIWCTLMISLWVKDEMSYDSFHANGDRIQLLLRNPQTSTGDIYSDVNTAYPIADELVEDFSEIVDRSRYSYPENMVLKIGEDVVETQIAATDPNFFEFFSFPLIDGDPASCLQDLKSIVISRDLAENHFHGKSPVGKVVTINEGAYSLDFIVKGVFDRIPDNSSLKFDAVIPIDNYLQFHTYPNSWGNSWLASYLLLDEKVDREAIDEKIRNVPIEKGKADWFTLYLQPFEDHYLYSKFEHGLPSGGRIDNIILFLLIALFTLLIACFNFINLTTARVSKRTVNIGIRKVVGASRSTLILQFLIESTLLIVGSVILALVLCIIFLPEFNALTSKSIHVDFLQPDLYILLFGVMIFALLFSGIYPAVFLSSFHPVKALKKTLGRNSTQVILRKVLVTLQFSIALIVMTTTITVLFQMSYVRNKDLGLDKENILVVQTDYKTGINYASIKPELLKHTSVLSVGATNSNFKDNPGSSSDPIWKNKSALPENKKWFAIMNVDYDLHDVLNLELVAGRYFSAELASDTANFMINEMAAQAMGLDHPVGEDLEVWGVKGKIIGVVKDFNFESLHAKVTPAIFRCIPNYAYKMFVRTAPGKTAEAIEHLESVHGQFSELPLNLQFLDRTLEESYKREKVIEKLSTFFSVITIFISCLGLFGLASYAAERRTKEIAIRRILGARLNHLLNLLFKEYAILIFVAFAISIPIAYLGMDEWLSGFAYRMAISGWHFILPAGLVVAIAFLTVSKISIGTARRNPAESLRNE